MLSMLSDFTTGLNIFGPSIKVNEKDRLDPVKKQDLLSGFIVCDIELQYSIIWPHFFKRT